MRKKIFLTMVLSIATSLLLSLTALASEKTGTDNTPYQFPVIPGTSEWESFRTKQEMLDVCQIPEDKLENMTTEALLETVMNYPLIDNFIVFNTIEDACDVMSDDFNGFRELFSRNDVVPILLERYSTANVLSADELESSSPGDFFEPATLEYLIACNEIKNGSMAEDDLEYFYELLAEKSAERYDADIYSVHSEIYQNYAEVDALARVKPGSVVTELKPLLTPNDKLKVRAVRLSPDYTPEEKREITRKLELDFPNAEYISEPTFNYNCHSYAWYKQSTSNTVWIPDAELYTKDSYYIEYDGRVPRSGMKGYYKGGTHSAVSIGSRTEDGVQIHYVESKWGPAGFYEHPFSYCPYDGSVTWYTVR